MQIIIPASDMRGLRMLLLFVASAQGLTFFVLKEDSDHGLCVTNDREYYEKEVLPIYNLSGPAPPPEGAPLKWTQGWEMENLDLQETKPGAAYGHDFKTTVTDGSDAFTLVTGRIKTSIVAFAQTVNATLVLSRLAGGEGGEGVRVHLGRRDAWAELCLELGRPSENCSRLQATNEKEGDFDLADTWVQLGFWFLEGRMEFWLNDKNILNWPTSFVPDFLFARTHSRPGVFRSATFTRVDPVEGLEENKLSRDFVVDGSKRLCVHVEWGAFGNKSRGAFRLIDSSGLEVLSDELLSDEQGKTILDLQLDSDGHFRLELVNVTTRIFLVTECPGGAALEISGAATGCAVFEGDYGKRPMPATTLTASHLNRSVQVDLGEEQLEQVCAALGVRRRFERVLWCTEGGCALERCFPALGLAPRATPTALTCLCVVHLLCLYGAVFVLVSRWEPSN